MVDEATISTYRCARALVINMERPPTYNCPKYFHSRMPRKVITDSSKTDILGPSSPNRNHHTHITPMIKLVQANDSNEGESDSGSEDGVILCRGIPKMPTNRNKESEDVFNKIYLSKKKPLHKVASVESNASTASSESWNSGIENREPSIRSPTCSESDSENGLKIIIKSVAGHAEIIGNLQVSEKRNNRKSDFTSSKDKDIAILLTQTSKLNLNCEFDNEKNLISKERSLPSSWRDNIHPSYNTDVSDENQDSDTSDDTDESSDSEDEDTYTERGPTPRSYKPEYCSEPYGRVEKRRERRETRPESGQDLAQELNTISRQIDPAMEERLLQEIRDWPFPPTYSEPTTNNINLISGPLRMNDEFWMIEPSLNMHLSPMSITVKPPLLSTSSQSIGSDHSSEGYCTSSDLSNADSLNGGSEDLNQRSICGNMTAPSSSNADFLDAFARQESRDPYSPRNNVPYGIDNSPGYSSISELSPCMNFLSSDVSPRSNDEISDFNNMGQFTNLRSSPVSETNETNTTETVADQWIKKISQTNVMNVAEVLINPVRYKYNHSNTIDLQMRNNDDARNTIIPTVINQSSSRMCPSLDIATPKANEFNFKNWNGHTITSSNIMITNKKDSNPVTTNINGYPKPNELLMVASHDKIHQKSFINSTNNLNVNKNSPSSKQDVNGAQVQTILTNGYKGQTWNPEPNVIPTPVREKSQPMPQGNSRPISPWGLLKLPSSDACARLMKVVNNSDVHKAMCTLIPWSIEKYMKPQGDLGDTCLMAIVRDPRVLKKYLHFVPPMVQRMVRIPDFLLKMDNQGRDALYLAAMNCPNNSYVTGYLAITIAELCQKSSQFNLNTYNSRNDTLMHVVAAAGDTYLDVMKELLAIKEIKDYSPFDPRAQNSDGNTPLHLAVQACTRNQSIQSAQMVRLLMKHGADICHRENKSGNTALHMAISHARSKAIVQALLDSEVNCTAVNVKNHAGNLPIHLAASDLNFVSLQTQVDICRRLIDYGSPTNIPNKQNKMPLALVAAERKEIMKNIFYKKL